MPLLGGINALHIVVLLCRAWLGCLPDRLSAEHALSVVAVLEPGDTQRLLAVLPTAAAAAAGPGSPSKATRPGTTTAAGANAAGFGTSTSGGFGLAEPSKLACAEGLVEQLVVCWEMITGAAATGQLPRGKVQLAPVDVAANMTPGAIASLRPSSLLLRFSAPPAVAAAGSSCPAELIDLASLALTAASSGQLSGPISGLSGPSGSSGQLSGPSGPPGQISGLSGPSGQPSGPQSGQASGSSGQQQLLSGLASLLSSGLLLPGLSGPLWGLHMAVSMQINLLAFACV
jgi:hypothetical protein